MNYYAVLLDEKFDTVWIKGEYGLEFFEKNFFLGPSLNENSWVSVSRDTIFVKKIHQKSFRHYELLLDVFVF